MRKKVLLVIVIWVGLGIVVGLLITHKHTPAKTTQTILSPPANEPGSNSGEPTFNVQNTGPLSNVLLDEQFASVKQALVRYIQSQGGTSASTATIVAGSVVVNDDGSVDFSVQTTNPASTFAVVLQTPSSDEIIFTVPANGYQDALYPYATGGDSE